MNGNCYFSEGINPTLTCNKNEGNRVAIPVEDIETNHLYNQRGTVHDVNGIARTLVGSNQNSGSGNEPKVAIPVLTPDRAEKRQNGRRFKEDGEESFTLTSQDRHGVAIGVDDLYANRNVRMYEQESPTLRSDRQGLKVALGVDGIIDDQGRLTKQCSVKSESPTLRSQSHGNEPKVVLDVKPVQLSGYECSECEDEAHALNCTDQRKVFGAHQTRTMVGYNTTRKSGGSDTNGTLPECEGLQGSIRKQSDDDYGSDVFLIDKGYSSEEREVANCIESREDRGLAKRKQEGTLVCVKVMQS